MDTSLKFELFYAFSPTWDRDRELTLSIDKLNLANCKERH